MLTSRERVRFARHLALPEIGDAGQVALLRAGVGAPLDDHEAEAVRVEYLHRAGVGGAPIDPPVSVDLDRVAGDPSLRHAAAALVGAFAATEHLKRIVGAGIPAAFPGDFHLAESP